LGGEDFFSGGASDGIFFDFSDELGGGFAGGDLGRLEVSGVGFVGGKRGWHQRDGWIFGLMDQ